LKLEFKPKKKLGILSLSVGRVEQGKRTAVIKAAA
jgi:hypothetical protein